jgi:hypothetical protein
MNRSDCIYRRWKVMVASGIPEEKLIKYAARWTHRYHLKGREHSLSFD